MSATAEAPTSAPADSRPRLLTRAAWVLVPIVLGLLVFEQARWFRESTCETYDEFTYLRMGICIFRLGDFKSMASPMTPPMPILLEYWLPSLSARSLPETGNWEYEVPSLIRQARLLTTLTIGLPLVWAVFGWLACRKGLAVGTLGAGLLALSPSVLAAASIATTDACFVLFALVALAALHVYQIRPSRANLALTGVGMGLALASKQSAVVLAPVVLLELLLNCPARRPGSTRVDAVLLAVVVTAARFAAVLAIMFVVDWSLYGFRFALSYGMPGTHTDIPIIIPMVADLFPNGDAVVEAVRRTGPPLAYDTFMGQVDHALQGQGAFLMGQRSVRGWWYFFPVAIALKSTPVELILFALAAALAFRKSTWADPARRLWVAALLSLLGLAMCSSINIGQRYILLAYPLVILLGADTLGAFSASRPRLSPIVGAVLLAWQAVSVAGVAPHYLCYFNSFCGGPSQGYSYLVDSSLDWGQGLPVLRRELESRGYHKVALAYFGTASPRAYGLRVAPFNPGEDPVASGCDFLAISATHLQGAYGDASLAEHFESVPKRLAGYSIFYFDLKDPRVRAAVTSLPKLP